MNKKDKKMFNWLKLFNQYDLYTKTDKKEIDGEILDYYKDLIKKYFIGNNLVF